MKAKWIAMLAPALIALALAGQAEAGGYGSKPGHYGPAGGYGHDYRGQNRGQYRSHHRGHFRGHAQPRHRGYRHAGRRHEPGYRGRGAYGHAYRNGYRHGYRNSYRRSRSYYPDAYVFDPVLGHVRGVYYPYSGGISLHFGY